MFSRSNTQTICEVVQLYSRGDDLPEQAIKFNIAFRAGDIFGPIGGDLVPANEARGCGIPVGTKFRLLPLTGATLLSFVKVGYKYSNLQAILMTDGNDNLFAFFKVTDDLGRKEILRA